MVRSKLLSLVAQKAFGNNVRVHGPFAVANISNVSIGDGCSINDGVFMVGRSSISIGQRVTLSARVMLIDAGLDPDASSISNRRDHTGDGIIIEDDVWIGAGAIVLPGVKVGKGSVIAAGSVVTANVDADSIYAGVPAKLLRRLNE